MCLHASDTKENGVIWKIGVAAVGLLLAAQSVGASVVPVDEPREVLEVLTSVEDMLPGVVIEQLDEAERVQHWSVSERAKENCLALVNWVLHGRDAYVSSSSSPENLARDDAFIIGKAISAWTTARSIPVDGARPCAHPLNSWYDRVGDDPDGDGVPDPFTLCQGAYLIDVHNMWHDECGSKAQVRSNLIAGVPGADYVFIGEGGARLGYSARFADMYDGYETLYMLYSSINGENLPDALVAGTIQWHWGEPTQGAFGVDVNCQDQFIDLPFSRLARLPYANWFPLQARECFFRLNSSVGG